MRVGGVEYRGKIFWPGSAAPRSIPPPPRPPQTHLNAAPPPRDAAAGRSGGSGATGVDWLMLQSPRTRLVTDEPAEALAPVGPHFAEAKERASVTTGGWIAWFGGLMCWG
jgi:hypothetical protein